MLEHDVTKEIEKNLPFEATFQRFSEREYFTQLPFATNDANCKKEFIANKNEIWYFGGMNAMGIVFEGCNVEPLEIVKLGDIVEDIVPVLQGEGEKIQVLFEVDKV